MFTDTFLSLKTIGALRAAGYQSLPVKDEMRRNLIAKLQNGEALFPGIIGYDDVVIPSILNAFLARHDMILLGLRGQAKTRIVRMFPSLLDEFIPIIKGSEINDNPFAPVSKYAVDLVAAHGDEVEIDWIPREQRYGEKLATPDVTIADLIGDIDPIKAATQRLHYSHEGVINFGLIPRTNRGIFTINELPDLQPRIQVGLFNIMQEKDIQIRGFSVRIPLDVLIVFTANPEDYTNRGNIITPLKDRIGSQILTHYPERIDDAIRITAQEAWIERDGGRKVIVPTFMREIIEQIAFQARRSEFVDHKSGVSARFSISTMEVLVSNAERRALMQDDDVVVPRLCDFIHVLPGMTGKVELVFEGEQEGTAKVGKALIGKAVRKVFTNLLPDPSKKPRVRRQQEGKREPQEQSDPIYGDIVKWFEKGNTVQLSDEQTFVEYEQTLFGIPGLSTLVGRYLKISPSDRHEYAAAMEFVLDGLHQHSKIAKEEVAGRSSYRDLVGALFTMGAEDDID